MKTVPALLLAACCTSAVACDRLDATQVLAAMADMGAAWSEQGGTVALELGPAWDGAADPQRLRLLGAFAASDACLAGQSRRISFHRRGQLVGLAAGGAVQLVGAGVRRAAVVACP
ncbi:hypothetical protein [Ramlibacter sp.]|uniref:hypothetical protein n=1 Tax=Ramlibacter sp. TaxID=1917967 RepID=UPI002BEAEB3C|nr:hypothetical protein [Ramlibacter sp.]HWI80775.1 hypothetical protein [Ramlibacter sp.]